MRFLSFFIFLFFLSTITSAQTPIHQNHVYVELLGTGGYSSIQYERQILKKTRLNIHGGLGAYFDMGAYFSGIIGAKYLVDTKWQNRFLEFGFAISATPSETVYYPPDEFKQGLIRFMPNAGFRWYTKNQWVWRISVLSVMDRDGSDPWIGFSLGKNF